jgi:uncharacterized protein YeaO (DUF488 family)
MLNVLVKDLTFPPNTCTLCFALTLPAMLALRGRSGLPHRYDDPFLKVFPSRCSQNSTADIPPPASLQLPIMSAQIKRAYENPSAQDGTRVLVDRLWPRGIKKETARIDRWIKEVAPSNELRKWFGHDPEKWPEFRRRYKAELKGNTEIAELKKRAKKEKLTLVYAAKDPAYNNAVVLKELIAK